MTRFAIALLALGSLQAQTRVAVSQIKDWRQVSAREIVSDSIRHAGTQLVLGQVRIDAEWIAAWKRAVCLQCYDYFQIAGVPEQPNRPILITADDDACTSPHGSPSWPFWFHRKVRCGAKVAETL